MLVAAALGAAPRLAAADDAPVHFRAQGLPTPNDASVGALAERTVLRAYLKDHPDVRIEPFSMPMIQGANLDSGPLMAIAAGVPPHAIYVNFRQSSTYIAQGFLDPLEVLLARLQSPDARVRQTGSDGRWLADPNPREVAQAVELLRARVPQPAWPVVYRPSEEGRDPSPHVWCLPTSNLVMALMYRRDLFHDAGLDPDRPPQTWDELLEYSRRLTRPERRQHGIMIPRDEISWSLYAFLVSNGARAVERDAAGRWRAVYDSREAAEAVVYAWRLIHGPFQRDGQTLRGAARLVSFPEMYWAWKRGEVAMQFTYLAEDLLALVNPQLVGVAPVPASPKGTRGSEVNCTMLGVFSGCTPRQKLAVMEYLWFVTGDPAKRLRTAVFVENDMGKFVNPVLLEKFGHERVLRQVDRSWKQAFDLAMKDGVPEPYGRNTQSIYRYMSEPIDKALLLPLGDLPHDQAVAKVHAMLRASAAEVNVKVLGIVPPAEMARRRAWAGGAVILVAVVFGLGLFHVWRHFTRTSRLALERVPLRRLLPGYALLVPALALVCVWEYLTLAGGLAMGFLDYRLAQDSPFVGLDNFAAVLFDDKFWAALWRSFYFVALMIGLGFWPPILLAILLHEVPTTLAKYVFRTIYFLPAVVSGLIVMFLWKALYDPSAQGLLNRILLSVNHLGPVPATVVKLLLLAAWLGLIVVLLRLPIKIDDLGRGWRWALWAAALGLIVVTVYPLIAAWRAGGAGAAHSTLAQLVGRFDLKPQGWINDPQLAMLCVIIPAIWAGSGPGCILYLAALKTVPDELYEAADIDGATAWHKVFYIVVPKLKYLIIIQFMGAVIGAFRGSVEYIMIMTGGGPNNATRVLPLEIFTRSFMELRYGIGTAMAWLLGALLIGFTAYQLKLLSRAEFRAGG